MDKTILLLNFVSIRCHQNVNMEASFSHSVYGSLQEISAFARLKPYSVESRTDRSESGTNREIFGCHS